MSEHLPAPRRAAAPAVRRRLADRTAEVLGQGEPEIRWRREVPPDAQVWVRMDGTLFIDDGTFELTNGAPRRIRQNTPYARFRALARPQVHSRFGKPVWPDSDWEWCRIWDGLPALGRPAFGRLHVALVQPLIGLAEWAHEADGDDYEMWRWWFADHNGVGRLQGVRDWIGLMDPGTGRPQWRIPWDRRPVAGGRRTMPADRVHVVDDEDAGIFAGLDADDGTILWTTEPTPEAAVDYGLAGDHVVRLLYRFRRRGEDRLVCDCAAPEPIDDEPNECRSCGRPLNPWIRVEVLDRASGRRLWTHRWPWTDRGDMVHHGALAVRGEVVLLREGRFLRARNIADGSRSWSAPQISVRGRDADRPISKQSHYFPDCAMDSPRQWAWLRFVEFLSGTEEEIDDVFVHATTGRTVKLPGAFHHTGEDLVLTLTGTTLTCFALPEAAPVPAPASSIVRPRTPLDRMRTAGAIAAGAVEAMAARLAPGITTEELDRVAHEYIVTHGGSPSLRGFNGYPKSSCTSVNEVICHGLPGPQALRDGDIVHLDVAVQFGGMHCSTGATFPVGTADAESAQLIDHTRTALTRAIKAIKPGRQLNVVGRVIESHAKRFGHGVVRDFTGHGIGEELIADPIVPSYDDPTLTTLIEPGMTFTIQPMLTLGTHEYDVLGDGWSTATKDRSRSAQFNHTIRVTEDGTEILSLPADGAAITAGQ